MFIELLGWRAELFQDGDQWYAAIPPLKTTNERILKMYIMFLEYVEFYLSEVNNG